MYGKFQATSHGQIILANGSYSFELTGKGYSPEEAKKELLDFKEQMINHLNKIKTSQ